MIARPVHVAVREPIHRPLRIVLLAAVVLGAASAGALADDVAHPAASSPSPASPVSSKSSARAASTAPNASASSPVPGRRLDLSPPPIDHIMTREQVQALVAEQPAPPSEDVTVESTHYEAPVPRGQLRAIPWAIMHPLQLWRIFAPVTDQ